MATAKNKIRAIIFSDLHLENWKQHNEGQRRLKNGLDVLKRIKLICKVHKAPALFAGDLFNKEKHLTNFLIEETFPYLYKIWGSGKFETYAITGNHDQSQQNLIDNQSPSYVKSLSKVFKGLHCLDFKSYDFGDWELYGVPYLTHDLGLVDYINNLDIDPGKVNILMLHTTMPNVRDTDGREMVSHLPTNEFEKAVGRFDIVFSGHIHKPMQFGVGKTTIVQVGAPQQQRFTDRNCEMGYWILYNNFEVEFKAFKDYPKFVELEPGQTKPDNKNFYITKPKKAKGIKVVEKKNFDVSLSGNKLARNYCKEKGIDDKVKKKALKQTLKKVL